MHAADPEPPLGIDGAVIEAHAWTVIHQGKRAQCLARKIVSCNLAAGGHNEIACSPKAQRRHGGVCSIGFQFLRRGMPAMNVLVLDEVDPVEPLLRGIPARAFPDHIADLDYIFRLHRFFIPSCWYAL